MISFALLILIFFLLFNYEIIFRCHQQNSRLRIAFLSDGFPIPRDLKWPRWSAALGMDKLSELNKVSPSLTCFDFKR